MCWRGCKSWDQGSENAASLRGGRFAFELRLSPIAPKQANRAGFHSCYDVGADSCRQVNQQVKAFILSVALLCSALTSQGQGPLSTDEPLKQLYHEYQPATETAQWICTKEQQDKGMHAGWPCSKEDATVAVSIILLAQVREGDATRTYLATSAKPAQDSEGEYNCHACAPAIGAAIFVWQGQHWVLESADTAIGFLGGWGDPASVELVAVGPEKHGFLLSWSDLGQGFASSSKVLLIRIGKSIAQVWGIGDESDDLDAIDPDDKQNSPPPYKSSATFRFLAGAKGTGSQSGYYDIEVTSSGTSWKGNGHPVQPENWIEIYRFRDGKYRLSHRTVLAKVKNPGKVAY